MKGSRGSTKLPGPVNRLGDGPSSSFEWVLDDVGMEMGCRPEPHNRKNAHTFNTTQHFISFILFARPSSVCITECACCGFNPLVCRTFSVQILLPCHNRGHEAAACCMPSHGICCDRPSTPRKCTLGLKLCSNSRLNTITQLIRAVEAQCSIFRNSIVRVLI
ncbi:hypothetical protein BDN72DRAFT_643067 [Pluteus cervinus]|uniref:Uncharacterized protein n=1 Tax=Pluteus cervinus TaxID=181527 RepID=A0ACD3ASP1_9AGAR|nr:hypothetical protein BDN72DRAFT_643067 [Pluteus cervinus]